jgi:predicted SnoaL-like aldol condensation-catalyzing enzyme
MNGHRVDVADDLITPDRPDHDPNLPPEFTQDREGFKRLFRMFISAFPDLRFENDTGCRRRPRDRVQLHLGDLRGRVHGHDATDICRFTDDGLIAEHWGVFDMGSMMQQLGVAPPG